MRLSAKIIATIFLLILCMGVAAAGNFSAAWNTSKISTGSSNSTAISLPLESSGTYAFTVWWGDGNSDYIVTWNQSNMTHNYASAGAYEINISGTIQGFRFNNAGDKLKIANVVQWGDLKVGNSGEYFYGCGNLTASATDALNLSGMTDIAYTFRDASSFNSNLSMWNVSNIISIYGMFQGATSFNGNVTTWDVSGATNTADAFSGATSFNQDIGLWDVSGVTQIHGMFYGATSFNQDIGSWDVTGTTSFYNMFNGATSFNQDIGLWDVSGATSFSSMFNGATSFDQDLGGWNASSITHGADMFNSVTLSVVNYDSLLIGWGGLPFLQNTVTFSGGNSQYSHAGANARNVTLIGTYGWAVTDGGRAPDVHIEFVDPTPVNDTYERNYIETNVTATTAGTLSLIVTSLYNSSGLVIHNTSANSPFYWNLTGLINDTYYLNATANNTLGVVNITETRTIVLGPVMPPVIASYAPLGTIWPEVYDSQTFNVTVNQSTQCRWYINGSLMEADLIRVTDHDYTNYSFNGSVHNVTVVVNNTKFSDSHTWVFEVGADSIDPTILSKDPTNLTCLIRWNVTRIGSNTTYWNASYSDTTNGYTYYFKNDSGVEILQRTATGGGQELWFNSSTLLPIDIYFITATAGEAGYESFVNPSFVAAGAAAILFVAAAGRFGRSAINSFRNRRRKRRN